MTSDCIKYKLSILIPIYNWSISKLLEELLLQIDQGNLNRQVEIIFIDDCSTDNNLKNGNEKSILKGQEKEVDVKYYELSENVGRVKIRNLLAKKSQSYYILFLDSDILPDNKNFIKEYLNYVNKDEYDVICGGISYKRRVIYGEQYEFYLYLSNKSDVKPSKYRNIYPAKHILTSNLMVKREVFIDNPLNISFCGYGYEDVEWGIRIAQKYKVYHIDNTVSHLGIVTKRQMYEKMRESIKNYSLLLSSLNVPIATNFKIVKYVQVLTKVNCGFLKFSDSILKRIFFFCKGNKISLVIFQLNKVILLAIEKKVNKLVTY